VIKHLPAGHGLDGTLAPDNVGLPSIRDAGDVPSIDGIEGEIEFRDLTFTYGEAREPALKDISLHIESGQTVAFVGAVGSGKSTMMNLVTRAAGPLSQDRY